MKTSHLILTAAALAALVGCREHGRSASPADPSAVTAATSRPAIPEPVAVKPKFASCVGAPGCNPLPVGLVVTIPYKLRSDRVYTVPTGADRRQVVFEFAEGDVDSVLKSLQKDFEDAGYEGKPIETTPEGIASMVFIKSDIGVANVWVNPVVGPSPVSKNAKGVFGIDFPMDASRPKIASAAE